MHFCTLALPLVFFSLVFAKVVCVVFSSVLCFCVVKILDLDHRAKFFPLFFTFFFLLTFLHSHSLFSFLFPFASFFFPLFLVSCLVGASPPCATSSYCLITSSYCFDLLPPRVASSFHRCLFALSLPHHFVTLMALFLVVSLLFRCLIIIHHCFVTSRHCLVASLPCHCFVAPFRWIEILSNPPICCFATLLLCTLLPRRLTALLPLLVGISFLPFLLQGKVWNLDKQGLQ